ncbi:MAG: hypothetical protein HKN44_15125 [Ilumatobacter sp.]|nr:hypothetical protein [Ilumatobacter sp.]
MTFLPFALAFIVVAGATGRVRHAPARRATTPAAIAAAPGRRRFDAAAAAWRRRWVQRRGLTPGSVVDWCDSLTRRLRSGATLRESVRVDVPADELLRALTADIRTGLERGRTLAAVVGAYHAADQPTVRGRRHLDLAVAALGTAAEFGGSAVAALDRVAITLRMRAADDQERVAQSAQARMSAHVLTLVPLGVVTLLVATDPAVRSTMTTTLGAGSAVAGLALNIGGWWWMRRIIGRER